MCSKKNILAQNITLKEWFRFSSSVSFITLVNRIFKDMMIFNHREKIEPVRKRNKMKKWSYSYCVQYALACGGWQFVIHQSPSDIVLVLRISFQENNFFQVTKQLWKYHKLGRTLLSYFSSYIEILISHSKDDYGARCDQYADKETVTYRAWLSVG